MHLMMLTALEGVDDVHGSCERTETKWVRVDKTRKGAPTNV